MLCTALEVLYTLAQRSFLVCWVREMWLKFAAGMSVRCLCEWVGEVGGLEWELLGSLIGTIVLGILDMCQRHPATGGNLGIGANI